MKIVHLVGGSLDGGAAKGAVTLCAAERVLGLQSTVLVEFIEASHAGNVPDYVSAARKGELAGFRSYVSRQTSQLPRRLYGDPYKSLFSTGLLGAKVTSHPEVRQADIVHLHWTIGTLAIADLARLGKPVVWTLRDLWPMTGGCHYPLGCSSYQSGCGSCPQLNSSRTKDLSHVLFNKKKESIPRDVRVVGISEWVSQSARLSPIFADKAIQTISNAIDTTDFFPQHQAESRRTLGLPETTKIVLIGALNVQDFYKGFKDFEVAWQRLRGPGVHLAIFGTDSAQIAELLGVEAISLGFLQSAEELRMAYSASDVFVAPSREEAFGKTIVEAQACGVPVVCFDATGPRDIVEHGVTGFRAEPFNGESLASEVSRVLKMGDDDLDKMKKAARNRASEEFDVTKSSRRYLTLYEEMLADRI